ncbi:MAG TPA: transposase [Pseudonocardia sp.]|nr:transposase [Pseudonocardia sp.]
MDRRRGGLDTCTGGHAAGPGQQGRLPTAAPLRRPLARRGLGHRGRPRGAGAPLATWLASDGITALDVPAKLATRVRILSTGHGRKNDDVDAISVGIAALTAPRLHSAEVEQAIIALRALVDHRDNLVRTRTQTINRLHVLLTQLLPGGASRGLNAEDAAQMLRGIRPRAAGPATLRRLAVELLNEVRHLDRRITTTSSDITTAVAASNSTLTQLYGLGDLTAAKIVARAGDITRFRSAAAFATYTGTAPIEVSSGDVLRHRLSRAGDRQLNCALHTMAITQIGHPSPGRDYYLRKRAAGKSRREALRCLKRRLSDIVYRQPLADALTQQAASPGGHQGATTKPSAAGTTPNTDSSGKSLPGPATTNPTTPQPRSS